MPSRQERLHSTRAFLGKLELMQVRSRTYDRQHLTAGGEKLLCPHTAILSERLC